MRTTTLLALLLLAGCTDNARSKNFGGSMTVELPKDTKLVTATWKEAQLWYLVRPRRTDEAPEEHAFIEKSGFGMIEGRVVFKER